MEIQIFYRTSLSDFGLISAVYGMKNGYPHVGGQT